MADPETPIPADVTSDSSPDPAAAVPDAAAPVDDETIVGDRPLRNIIAEIERKHEARIASLKGEMLAALREVGASQASQLPPASKVYSDEELSQLAAAGDARALEMLTDRKSAQYAARHAEAQQQSQAGVAALQALIARYPVLRDDAHPLTLYATRVKHAMMQRGAPDAVNTIIDAVRTAIADNPQIAAQAAVSQATASGPPPRTGSAATAPAPRRHAPALAKATVTDAQWTLAKRYGYKTREDAAKAIENFEKRQDDGRSRLGAVASFVREDA